MRSFIRSDIHDARGRSYAKKKIRWQSDRPGSHRIGFCNSAVNGTSSGILVVYFGRWLNHWRHMVHALVVLNNDVFEGRKKVEDICFSGSKSLSRLLRAVSARSRV